jgi:hypothetical protein
MAADRCRDNGDARMPGSTGLIDRRRVPMAEMDIRRPECFRKLCFGRAGERLRPSRGRVGRPPRPLKDRIGAPPVEHTGRRVATAVPV